MEKHFEKGDFLFGLSICVADGCAFHWYIFSRSHIAVFPLDEAEECRHVRPAKVVAGPQPGEQTPLGQPLEVVLADVLREETF